MSISSTTPARPTIAAGCGALKLVERGTLNAQHSAITSLQFAQCWSLDPAGNWKNFREDDDGNGSWNLDQTRTASKANEITDVTEAAGPAWMNPVYSRAGSMTTIPKPTALAAGYTGVYDAWHRLVEVVDGANTLAEYRHDALNRRVVKKLYVSGVLDQTLDLYYSHPERRQCLEVRVDGSSDPGQQFAWGLRYVDDLLLRDRDTNSDGTLDERLYGAQDATWNLTCLASASGVVQERFAYDAYGAPVVLTALFASRSASNYDWNILRGGSTYDLETGLYYQRARFFHTRLGQFISRDPLGYGGSPWNLYEYAYSNPLRWTDPTGEAVHPVVVACGAGLAGCSLCAGPGLIACLSSPDFLYCWETFWELLPT